jgi:3-oxoacyl-(acyl-carrier-protein) synthase
MNKPAYINAQACISSQDTFDNALFLRSEVISEPIPRRAHEPDYKDYIPRKYLRRMGRMVRMGVSAARKVLDEASLEIPDAILVGTGMGCLRDTEEFLTSIYESGENIASPNQFIQSTHNNVAAQIAIMLGCYNYNFTYVHRGFSFETALIDALLHIQENDDSATNILVGASDELTDMHLKVMSKLNFWKPREGKANAIPGMAKGYEQGEGAAFFVLSSVQAASTVARLDGVKMIYKPTSTTELASHVWQFLDDQKIALNDIDLILLGFEGGDDEQSIFRQLVDRAFGSNHLAVFKHLSGEFKTAAAFATWLAAEMIQKQVVPNFVKLTDFEVGPLRRVLIFNNYNNSNYTLSLLSHV